MINYVAGERLRYSKLENLEPTQNLYLGYFQEQINSYGVDCIYFRKDNSFYQKLSNGSHIEPYIYGESPTDEFNLSGNLIIYLNIATDTLLLDAFNIRSDNAGVAYITIPEFQYNFQDMLGEFKSEIFTIPLSGTIENFNYNTNKKLTIGSADVEISLSGNLSEDIPEYISTHIKHIPVIVNKDLKNPWHFHEHWRRHLIGTLKGEFNKYNMDIDGNGEFDTVLSGEIGYFDHSLVQDIEIKNRRIAPQVGDFFRLEFEDLEYEITEIRDMTLEEPGLNPLLSKYIWKCDVVRRQPSHENIIGDSDKEPNTASESYQEFNQEQKDIVKQIFNYSEERVDKIDGPKSDDVYGTY